MQCNTALADRHRRKHGRQRRILRPHHCHPREVYARINRITGIRCHANGKRNGFMSGVCLKQSENPGNQRKIIAKTL